jgi:hypothetical protein
VFRMILSVNSDYFPNSVNQLIAVMVKCCFLCGTDLISKYYLDELP